MKVQEMLELVIVVFVIVAIICAKEIVDFFK
jgi:hypothetical protein